jgi:hypothetical protein
MKKASPPIHAEASHSHGQFITGPAQLLRTALSKIAQVLPSVARCPNRAYSSSVVTLLATGRRNLNNQAAHKRPYPKAGAFFVPVTSIYGGGALARFGVAGFRLGRFLPSASLPPYPVGRTVAVPKPNGATPMQSIRNLRAAAHRRMAFAALHADSSLRTRLSRYQHHINQARALEAVGGAV